MRRLHNENIKKTWRCFLDLSFIYYATSSSVICPAFPCPWAKECCKWPVEGRCHWANCIQYRWGTWLRIIQYTWGVMCWVVLANCTSKYNQEISRGPRDIQMARVGYSPPQCTYIQYLATGSPNLHPNPEGHSVHGRHWRTLYAGEKEMAKRRMLGWTIS